MKVTDGDLREALGHRGPGDGSGREGCPTTEAIVMLAEGAGEVGEAGEEPRAREVLDHVSRCSQCAAEYRLASSLKPWADGASSALRAAPPSRAPVRSRAAWWPQALAGSLVLSVGLAGWNLVLRGQGLDLREQLAQTQGREAAARLLVEKASEAPQGGPAAAPAPALNVPIVDLDAGGTRGAAAAATVLRVPPGTPWLTFVLTVSGGASAGAHHLEILGDAGRVVWAGDGLVANRFGTFTLAVPAALLRDGSHQFVLSQPSREGARRVVQTYPVVVRTSEP